MDSMDIYIYIIYIYIYHHRQEAADLNFLATMDHPRAAQGCAFAKKIRFASLSVNV